MKRVKSTINEEAHALFAKHADALPDCQRAPGHLQFATLAMAAQRTLLREAKEGDYLAVSGFKARYAVADAVGVVAPPDGSTAWAVNVQYVPNKIALALTGALWISSRRQSMASRMMDNFVIDLGQAFDIVPLEGAPEPSRVLTRCFYHDLLHAEGDDVALLSAVFGKLHESSWAGVPGFRFSRDEDTGSCEFVFDAL